MQFWTNSLVKNRNFGERISRNLKLWKEFFERQNSRKKRFYTKKNLESISKLDFVYIKLTKEKYKLTNAILNKKFNPTLAPAAVRLRRPLAT